MTPVPESYTIASSYSSPLSLEQVTKTGFWEQYKKWKLWQWSW